MVDINGKLEKIIKLIDDEEVFCYKQTKTVWKNYNVIYD